MGEKVRCAVIGAGWWGTTAHVPALKAHPNAELIAVQHHDESTAQRIAQDFKIERAYSSSEELLSLPDLDAVVISSTPHLHFSQAKAALERGIHVLLEKPMVINSAQAEELVKLSRMTGAKFLIGCTWHYTSHAAEAQRLIRSGELGFIHMICIWMMDYCLGLYQSLSWQEMFADNPNAECDSRPYLEPGRQTYSEPTIAGGGQIYNQVSHPAAYLSFLTGQRPLEVHALFDNAGTKVDVYDVLNIRLEGGTIVSLASTGDTGKTQRNMNVRVYGSKAILDLELFRGTMSVWSHDGSVRDFPPLSPTEIYPMQAPAANLVDVVTGKAENRSPAELGLYATQIIEAACASAMSGKVVSIQQCTEAA